MFRLENKKDINYLELFLLFLVFVLIFSIVVLACVPPVSKDALTHHLAIPKLYLKHGGIYEIPFMPFSYFPMNLDLLYLIPLYFENDIVPKFIHFTFGLLTAWLIFNYLKRRVNIVYALIGGLFFLSIPIIVKLSITVYVDLGLIFFSTASLLLLLKWIEDGFPLKFLMLSALFCGLAVGTKYNGLVTLFLLTFFVPFLYLRHQQDKNPNFLKAAGYGILFLFIAFIFFSPWMIKNYLWTTNPIFPLYDHWFNPQDAIDKKTISLFTYRSLIYHESWWQMALLPVRIFFQGQDGNPQYFDGRLNPFLFFLPFFAFYGIKRDPAIIRNEKKIMLTFVVLFFAFAFFSSSLRIRMSPQLFLH
jgi:4-amino-4-deoxy-L-arabinose transferase-like glycosyltransferase